MPRLTANRCASAPNNVQRRLRDTKGQTVLQGLAPDGRDAKRVGPVMLDLAAHLDEVRIAHGAVVTAVNHFRGMVADAQLAASDEHGAAKARLAN